ncbi:MAG: TIGR01244 family sulfur transferase [Gammaproteobacteria bacterium]|nr:TIGR01244 family sulfur transferase [Gammaproteobacteria bacterium]
MGDVTGVLEFVNVTPEFAIGPQVSAEDFAPLRAAGFASVLNARPDDETGTYLVSLDAQQLAHANGLAYAHSPTENHAIFEPEIIDRFERALVELPKPIFAHCKTGTRAAILWALVASRHRAVENVIATLRAAGQELDFLEQELRESAKAARQSPFGLKEDALLGLGRSSLLGGSQTDPGDR